MTRERMLAGEDAIAEPAVPYEVITLEEEDDDEIVIVHAKIQPKKKRNKRKGKAQPSNNNVKIDEIEDTTPSSADNIEENDQKPVHHQDGELKPADPPTAPLTHSTDTPQLDITPEVPLHSLDAKKRGPSDLVPADPEKKKIAQVHPELAVLEPDVPYTQPKVVPKEKPVNISKPFTIIDAVVDEGSKKQSTSGCEELRMKNTRVEKKTGMVKGGEKAEEQQEKKPMKSSLQIRAANNFKRMISATVTPNKTAEEAKSLRDAIENGEKMVKEIESIESSHPPISPVSRKDETSASKIMLQNGVSQVSRENSVSRKEEEEVKERREKNSSNTANNNPSLKYTDIQGNKIIVDGSVVPPSGSTVVTSSQTHCPSTPLNGNGRGMEVALPMPPSIPTRFPGRKKSKVLILEKITRQDVSSPSTPSTPALSANVEIARKAVESSLSSAGLFIHHIHKKRHDLATLEEYMGKFPGLTSIALSLNHPSSYAVGVVKFRSSADLREPLETGKVTEMGSWHTINGHDLFLTPLKGPNQMKVKLMIKDKENEEEKIRERKKKKEKEEEERRARKKDEEKRKRDKEERYRDRSSKRRKSRSRSRDKYRDRRRSNERRRSRSRERRRRDQSRNDERKRRDRSNEILDEIMENKFPNARQNVPTSTDAANQIPMDPRVSSLSVISKPNEAHLNKPVDATNVRKPLVSHETMKMLMDRLKTMPDTTGYTEPEINVTGPAPNHIQHYALPYTGQMAVPPPPPPHLTEIGWSSHQAGMNSSPPNYDQYYYYHTGQQ